MSARELIVEYLRERFPARVFVPLAALLVLLAGAGARPVPSAAWALRAFVMILPLLLALRILDDLADRGHDRRRHPRRITVRAERLHPLVTTAGAALSLAVAAGAARRTTLADAMMLATMVLALAAWYALRAPLDAGRLLNSVVVLLKYPAIVVATAPPSAGAAVAALAATAYLGVIVHDLADDPDLRRTTGGSA